MLGIKAIQSKIRYFHTGLVSEKCIREITHLVVRILADEFKENPYGVISMFSRYGGTINQFKQGGEYGTKRSTGAVLAGNQGQGQ